MRNIEIKARISDSLRLEERLAELNVDCVQELRQIDTFFSVLHGRLKLRDFGNGTAELIHYHRADRNDAKLSDYERVPVDDAHRMRSVLARALGIRGTITKNRRVMLLGKIRIHVDIVEGLGRFLEIEVVLDESDTVAAGEAAATTLMKLLELPAGDLIAGGYIDLLESGRAGAE